MANPSCFEVMISPVIKATQVEPEESEVLVLAPFTRPPRLDFKNVEVGLMKKRLLIIRNLRDVPVKVDLVQVPSIEKGFTFSATQLELQPHSEDVIEIAWTPIEEGSWRFVLGVKTNCTLKMDVIIICTSMKKTLAQKKKKQRSWAQSLPSMSRSNKADQVHTSKIGSHDDNSVVESSIINSTTGHRWTSVPSHSVKRASPYSQHVNVSRKTLFEEQGQLKVARDLTQEYGIPCHPEKVPHERERMKCKQEIFSAPLKSCLNSFKVDEFCSVGRRNHINDMGSLKRSRYMSRLFNDALPEMNSVFDSPAGQPLHVPKSVSDTEFSTLQKFQIELPKCDNSTFLHQTTFDFVPSSSEINKSGKEPRTKNLCGVSKSLHHSTVFSEDFIDSLDESKPDNLSEGTNTVKSPNYLQGLLEFDKIRLSSEIESNAFLQNSQNSLELCHTPKACSSLDVYQFSPIQYNARSTGREELNTKATHSNISCTVPEKYCAEFSVNCQGLEFQASRGTTPSEKYSYLNSLHSEHGKHPFIDSPVFLTHHHPEDVSSSVLQTEPDINSSLLHYTTNIFNVRSSNEDSPLTPLRLSNKAEIIPQRKGHKPAIFQKIGDTSTTSQNINCASKSAELSSIGEDIESSFLSCKNISKSNPIFPSRKFEEEMRIDALPICDNIDLTSYESSRVGTETSNFVKSGAEPTENSFEQNSTYAIAAEKMENNTQLDVTKGIPESLPVDEYLNISPLFPRKIFEIKNNADRLEESQSSPRQGLKDISHFTNIENLNMNNNAVETSNKFYFNKPNMVTETIKKPASCNRSTKDHTALRLEFSPPEQNLKENVVSSTRKPLFKQFQTPRSKGPPVRGTDSAQVIRKRPRVVPVQRLILLSAKKSPKLEKSIKLHDPDGFLSNITNPKNSISTSVVNPFLRSAIYYDEQWFEERAKEFIKWLNYLLTPPEQLSSRDQLPQVNVADLWNKCCKEDVAPAPSRETVSSLYHTNHRLDSLRRAACTLYQSSAVSEVLSKVLIHIDKGILSVRQDLNLHLDVGMQKNVVSLILCYNPLWLRIGLETIYGKTIPLESNSDAVGLVAFIVHNLLSDPYLVQQYSYKGVLHSHKPGFETAMKKLILKRFLFLIYFLDYAKEKKLIHHDPCLFCKNAMYKKSRDILLAFARDFLSGIGDITKHLRNLGYVVVHNQTYLHEYKYAVTSLGSDLRDGIRLVRVMEIILQKPELSLKLRAPAESKLQKISNVKVAFEALKEAGFHLEGGISPKDIAEGHKEKTLSLLWQIIYKFQAPHFNASAAKIQAWWHKNSLKVEINNRICMRKTLEAKAKACITIQKYWRGFFERKRYKRAKAAIIKVQARWRSFVLTKKMRSEYLTKRKAIVQLQSLCRGYLSRKKFKKEVAAYRIQTWYKRILAIRKLNVIISLYKSYCKEKKKQYNASVLIQEWYKRILSFRKLKATIYLYNIYCEEIKRKLLASVVIQRWYRKQLAVRRLNATISLYRAFCKEAKKRSSAAIVIQRHYRRVIEKRRNKDTLSKIILIQKKWRATILMNTCRASFLNMKASAIKIQAIWRGYNVRKNTTIRSFQERTKQMDQDNCLRKRYTSVLNNWLPSNSYGELLLFVQVIDTVTRLSRELTEEVSSAKCLKMLFVTMSHCNRSIPAAQVLEFSTSIMVNLVKHANSMENVWKAKTVGILLQLMTCWCGKSSVIFCNCCTVLWLLAQDPRKAEIILETENMRSLLIKFHEIEKRRSKSGKNAQRRDAHASEPKGHKFKLPDITPEWELAKRNKPRTFQDPFFAILSLMKKLGLELEIC